MDCFVAFDFIEEKLLQQVSYMKILNIKMQLI